MNARWTTRWLAALLLAAAAQEAAARGVPVDGYAAVVNKQVITVGEVLALIQPVRLQLEGTCEGPELEAKLKEAFRMGLNALIERSLILEEFAALGGELPDRIIDDQTSQVIAERFHNDRAEFLKALAEERVTLDEWREQTKNRLIVNILRRREVTDRVMVSPRAVRELYESRREKYLLPEQVQLRTIVLHQGATPEDQAAKRAEADGLRAKAMGGDDFAALAKSSSEGSKAAEGGDMGWVEPKALRPELAQAVARLEAGGISDVIDAGEEFYILKVEARKNESIVPFDEARPAIEEELRRKEEDRLFKAWIGRLRNKYYVKIYTEDEPPEIH